MSTRWFRHYAGMMRDDKLVSAALKAKQPVERVVWIWGAILESAAEIDDAGRFEFDCAEAAYFLRADEADIRAVVDALTASGRLDSNRVVKWGDRQFQSDRSAERQARYRDKRRGQVRHGDSEQTSPVEPSDVEVTAASRHGDAPETETETETEKEPPTEPIAIVVEVAPSQASGATLTLVENDEPDSDELPAMLDRRAYPAEFEVSWKAYLAVAPKNATKADAHRGWTKLSAAEKADFAKGLLAYIAWFSAEAKRDPTTKIKHLATFIAKRGWEPFLEAEQTAVPTIWLPCEDPRFEPACNRVEQKTGRRPRGLSSKYDNGVGYYFPAELISELAA